MTEPPAPTVVGRYVLHAPIARGGMATIHLARLLGAEGFSRTVAAKRLHPQFTEDAEFLRMFLDEARIASKVHHPNVVPMLDVVQSGTEVILVQEYVHGVPFDKLLRAVNQQKKVLPVSVVIAIVSGMLAGLHAAHEAKDELGQPLGIVHRDVSPQNVLVGVDGIPRLLDFGVAKATLSNHVTRAGVFKGKLAYTSPELLQGTVTQSTDIYAASVVLWEALAGRRLYLAMNEAELVAAVMAGAVQTLSEVVDPTLVSPDRWELLKRLEPIVGKGLSFAMADRYETAAEMQDALLKAAPIATPAEVSKWVKLLGREYLEGREKVIVSEESSWRRQKSAVPGAPDVPVEEATERSAPGSAPGVASQPSATATALQTSVMAPIAAPERGRAQWAIVGVLLLIGGLLGAILLLLIKSPKEATPIAGATTTTTLAAAPTSLPSPEPVASAAVPITRPGSSADSGADSSAPTGAAPLATPSPRAVPAARRAIAPTPPPAPASDCNPPFYFDGKKKIFKPGCL
jgi:eukaryotic-like serine/threonine-protein kinase